MDTGGGEERRDYNHETEEQTGEHEKCIYQTEESREYGRNQESGDHNRGESTESERSEHRRDPKGEEPREYERGEESEQQVKSEGADQREYNRCCYPYTTKRRSRHRDIRHVNYAFSGPHEDVAEKEAQEWLDNLSIAGAEDENDPFKIWPKGQKYRTGTTNESSQMQERLQRCEQNQERHEYRKHIPRLEKRNESPDIYPLLHVEEKQKKPEQAPLKLWGNTRRSCMGNNSASVYAVMHPNSENRVSRRVKRDCLVRKNPEKVFRNHLKEHRAAIAEMSAKTHFFKKKEREEEARRLAAVKIWDGSNCSKKKFPIRVRDSTDFVEQNVAVLAEQSQYAREVRENPVAEYSFMNQRGKVPQYLHQRKRELLQQAEERRGDREGMTRVQTNPERRDLMAETERLQTLEVLEQRHKHLIKVLKSFPLIFDTAHQIKMRSDVEQELTEIEASHKYYSNPKIYLVEPHLHSHPQSITFAKSPLSMQRTSHSQFPQSDRPLQKIQGLERTHIIPMTYSYSRCDTCFSPMQRIIKAPESTKPLRCTACALKLKTRSRSLWALKKPVSNRTPHFSR